MSATSLSLLPCYCLSSSSELSDMCAALLMLRGITSSDRKEITGYISASELSAGSRETSGDGCLSALGKEKSMSLVTPKQCPLQGCAGATSDHPSSH